LPQFERWWSFIGQRVMTLSLNLTTLPFVGGRWFGTRRLRVARWKVLVIGDAQTAKGAPFFKHNHPAW
jgi:hypothetical protein